MTPSPKQDPIKDGERLNEIARLRLHDSEIDDILNGYVKAAAEEFNLPIALVSIVLDDVQKFAAAHGLAGWLAETMGTPVEWSFCANSVRSGDAYVIPDSFTHEDTKENPLVTMDGIACYAGAPMISKNGYIVGNFCVIGQEQRDFSDAEIARLRDYAQRAMNHIEARAAELSH